MFYNNITTLLLSGVENVLKSTQQAATALQLLKKLDIMPQPMFRPQGATIKPLTLFQKMGVGQLDLYILSPGKNSQEYETFMQNWPDGDESSVSKSQTLPLTALVSVSALLVWHPACPQEKVVRVLFPGITPQPQLLQGLEKLKGLNFLQRPTVTTGDLERLGEDRKTKRTESLDSCRSQGKEGTPRNGKERGLREEAKDVSAKEKGKTLNGVSGRDTNKTKSKETGLKHKAGLSEKNTSKKGVGKDGKKEEKTGNKEENSITRSDQKKKDGVNSKPKNENKVKLKKGAKNESKTGEKKLQKTGKELNNVKKVHVNTDLPNNNSAKSSAGAVSKTSEPELPAAEKQNEKVETGPEENPCTSKVSTPEDITADFLQLQEESKLEEAQLETADGGKKKSSESGNEKSIGSLSEAACTETIENKEEEAASAAEVMKEESDDSGVQHIAGTNKKAEVDPKKTLQEEPVNSSKPAKVVGFPVPLNRAPKDERTVQIDTTPTEYTLLEGALRSSPPSQSSPENQDPNSPEDQTVEPTSPNSRPNSAGHTPYCLSPDDVWCNRATLSRLQAQMGDLESADPSEPNGSKQSAPENHTNSKEKHLSFFPLGTFKDGCSDPSPSVATTTPTTHSMPAEVSSPQSTEVDESLSMSFEQGPTPGSQREGDDCAYHSHSNGGHFVGVSLPMKKPPRSLGQSSELGRPLAPNTLHFEASAHDVDLCLVSPCEFKHFKPADSSPVFAVHHHGNNNNNPKDRSPSESNAPACTEDCPSTTADGALDSDDDESCSEPSNSPHDLHAGHVLPPDPPPAPLRDSPPLPPHPDASMPVPQSDTDAHRKRAKATGMKGKKITGVSLKQFL